jgi:hypothetical protein
MVIFAFITCQILTEQMLPVYQQGTLTKRWKTQYGRPPRTTYSELAHFHIENTFYFLHNKLQ